MVGIAQFPGLGMYDEGGKFEVKQEFIDEARAKAIEEGKKYYGDATNFEVFRDSVLNLPDAAINFVARGAEGTGELVAGIASLAMKGGQLATTTDPDKITQIMSEPSFTKYMGAYKGKLGKPDLFTSDISGIEENVDRVGDVAYFASPVPMAPFAKGIPFLLKASKAAKEGTKQTSKKLTKGQVTDALDEIGLENLKNLSVDDVSNLLSSKFGIEASGSTIRAALRSKNIDFKKATEAGGKEITEKGQFKPIEISPTQQESLNNIYEQVRLGKTQVKDAEIQANEIVQGAGGSDKFRTGYASYVKNLNVDDIYSFMQNKKYDNIKVKPKTVDKALELIDEAKKLDSDLEFGINFAQAYKNINKGVDEPFTKNYQTGGFTRMRKIVEDILQWKKKNDPNFVDSKDSTYINTPVRFSDDGTKLEVIVRKDTAEFYSTYKKLFSDSDQAILDGFKNDVIQSGGFASTDSGARFRVEGLISRYLYNALGIDKKTKVSKATQFEIIENLKNVDKEKLAQVIKLDRELKLKLSQAKELGIDLDDFNLSHMEDVASNWMNSLNANNLFFATSKANKSLQKNINRKIKNNLEKGKKAKTEAEKTEILNEFNDLKQQLIDNNLVSVIDGQKIGADIDFEKSFEIMSTVYDEAINKRLFPFKKDGGIVGIDYLTRPL